ncbi:MAG: hypothetical protein Q9162_007006 [Coniocarpon cinnabarinum]
MLFSALYKMLPSAQKSLIQGGSSSRAAAWILIATFLAGVFGIQIFSRIVHRFMPSTAVDCDHTHGQETTENPRDVQRSRASSRQRQSQSLQRDGKYKNGHSLADTEDTPLLSRSGAIDGSWNPDMVDTRRDTLKDSGHGRPTLQSRVTSTMANFVNAKKSDCHGEGDGPCYGYSHPCGPDCFKKVSRRGGMREVSPSQPRSILRRAATTSQAGLDGANNTTAHTRFHDHVDAAANRGMYSLQEERDLEGQTLGLRESSVEQRDLLEHDHGVDQVDDASSPHQHHHHIPKNAFLSISLQTSIAIALHKIPEGFITYATNHANPTLGVTVFVAIAIHNITEGFALALPIFLACGSRLQALLISFFLGGLSQPAGAGVAAAWLKLAERDRGSDANKALSDSANGGMFAVTAGIMASVALSLLQESFELSHKKNLCMMFAFIGMGILGMSSALTA